MAAPILPHIKAGKMTALAVSSKRRSPQLPDVPTIDESMVPNFVVDNWVGIFAPAGTPPAIVNVLSKSISNMVKDPTQRKKLVELGFEPVGSDPATLSTQVGSSLEKWKSIAERIGMTK
jgi:tripartite-type tricarboxylate transporter receptor subunit TctC